MHLSYTLTTLLQLLLQIPQDQMVKKIISFSSDLLLKACLIAVQTCGVQICVEWLKESVLQV